MLLTLSCSSCSTMFSGFKSRCVILWECKYSTAEEISLITVTATFSLTPQQFSTLFKTYCLKHSSCTRWLSRQCTQRQCRHLNTVVKLQKFLTETSSDHCCIINEGCAPVRVLKAIVAKLKVKGKCSAHIRLHRHPRYRWPFVCSSL